MQTQAIGQAYSDRRGQRKLWRRGRYKLWLRGVKDDANSDDEDGANSDEDDATQAISQAYCDDEDDANSDDKDNADSNDRAKASTTLATLEKKARQRNQANEAKKAGLLDKVEPFDFLSQDYLHLESFFHHFRSIKVTIGHCTPFSEQDGFLAAHHTRRLTH